jgi:hypothetical protein
MHYQQALDGKKTTKQQTKHGAMSLSGLARDADDPAVG